MKNLYKLLVICISVYVLTFAKSYSQEYGWTNIGERLPDTISTGTISDIAIVGDSIWIASGYGTYQNGVEGEIYFSPDRGKTYSIQKTKYGTHAIHMINAKKGWCGGVEGQIYRTVDGGETWERLYSLMHTVNDIDFPDNCDTGIVVGQTGCVKMITPKGLVSVDMQGYVSNITSVSCIDSVHAFIAGEEIIGPIIRGKLMIDQSYPGTNGIYAIDMVDTLYGWCVGSPTAAGAYDGSGCMIIRTTDGHNWEDQINPVKGNSGTLMAIKAINKLEAWAAGTGGVILHTTDGGINWRREAEGLTSEMLYGIYVINNKEVFVTGNNRTVLRYGQLTTTDVDEDSKDQRKMEVYPNPAMDMIYFKLNSHEVVDYIRIIDLQGKQVLFQKNIVKPGIHVSNLPKGIYFLEIKTDKNIFQEKIVKE